MARDRLAALRAQQKAQYAGSASTPSSSTLEHATPAPRSEEYEMKAQPGPIRGMADFYSEISSIQDGLKELNGNITRISELQSHSLKLLDDESAQYNAAQLEELVAKTHSLRTRLKARIENLREGGDNRDKKIRAQQIALVGQRFIEAIQRYQQVEQQYRAQCRDRVTRQLKIVNPNATADQIEAATASGVDGQQVFADALQTSSRYGESRMAYREVQDRSNDLRQIERSLSELAQLFNDMSMLVAQQDETINAIETTAIDTEAKTEAALGDTKKAVLSAIRARKARWICFLICVAIIAALALGLGIHFGVNNHSGSSNNK